MAQTIKVRRGVQASVSGASLATGEIIFTTDTGMVYVYDGSNKILIGRVLQGTLAGRPTFGVSGRLYYATDGGDTYLDTGSAWVTVGVNNLSELSGTLDDISDGSTYGRVKISELSSGQVAQIRAVTGTANVTGDTIKTHLDATNNPHSTDVANLGAGTAAELNSTISDATYGAGLNDGGTTTSDMWSASKIQSQIDGAVAGLTWKDPVNSINLIGNATEVVLNGLTPAAGDCYVATEAFTPSEGSSDALSIGSVTEFDGADWKELEAGVGNFVANGVRAALSTATALIAPYTDATDDGKIVAFDGTSLTGAFTTDAVEHSALLCQDSANIGVNDNSGYVFEGAVPTGTWIQFTGTGSVIAGAGLGKTGNTLYVKMGAGIVELPAGEVGIDLTSNKGLELTVTTTGGTLQIKTDVTTGATVVPLNLAANGAGVLCDNSSVYNDSGTLKIKAAGVQNSHFASNVVESDGGIALDAGNNGLEIKPDATTGATVCPIATAANGAGTTLDNASIVHTAGTLSVGVVDGGTF